MGTRSKLGWLGWSVGAALKLGFSSLALLLPLLGVWIASSLAAHHDGPLWLSLAAGALCFPLLPWGWEVLAQWRRANRSHELTWLDRIVLRTLAVNLVFVGSLLAVFPGSTFEALSTRGDWMLGGSTAPWAERARGVLFEASERLEWLHQATHDNAYTDLIDPALTRPRSEDGRPPQAGQRPRPAKPAVEVVSPSALYRHDGWPFGPALHPVVAALPAEADTSIASVAAYIVKHESDPLQRVKALHDYVADRVAYDVPALRSGDFPPQDAESVFARGTGVCAGSAALLAALGEAAGVEIVVVVGDARDANGLFDGAGHAWNAIKLHGRWYLADPTWDAGYVNGDTFTKRYTSAYFLTPPEVFVATHRPDDPQWQLLDEPLSLGDFIRQPHLRPTFAQLDLELLAPQRARHSVAQGSTMILSLANPHRFRVSGSVRAGDDPQGQQCQANREFTQLSCAFPDAGRHQLLLFGPAGGFLGKLYVDVG